MDILAVMLAFFAAALGLTYAILWLVARFVHTYLAVSLGIGAVAYLIYSIVDGIRICSAPPTYIPPGPSAFGEGRYEFVCDAAGGAYIYAGLYFVYPLIALLLTLITYRIWRLGSVRKQRA